MSFMDFTSTKLTSFEPGEFDSESFTVDEFIQRKRYSVPLDVLRDDLGSHLKFLRSSLIELINQDYGHFVNLSSNLVGLDGRIQNISTPLIRAQVDLENLQDALASTLTVLWGELKHKKSLHVAKSHLQFLRFANSCMESAEKCLLKVSSDVQTSSDFISLKVACEKVAETKALIQKCQPSLLLEELQTRWDSCCKSVLEKLQTLLITYASVLPNKTGVLVGDTDSVVQSLLFMFSQLDCENVAEVLFTQEILKPYCEEVLSRKGNVTALLDHLEEFKTLTPLVRVSQALGELPWMKNYDFISRGIFPHVSKILSQKFPHIWSPSTPDTFHSNWIRAERFIESMEASMPSLEHLERFRDSDSYKEFVGKWQFNVYFQLRFHTFAIELESALESLETVCSTTEFRLEATRVLNKILQQCWDKEKFFIWQLSGRFLKASALFLSRYLKEINRQITSNPKVGTKQLLNASWDVSRSEVVFRPFITDKIEYIYTRRNSPATSDTRQEIENFVGSFEWSKTKEELDMRLIEVTVSQSDVNISSVTEVPRLFRRTNREVSTKHSEYVNGILDPIYVLTENMDSNIEAAFIERVCQQVMNRYIFQVEAVLTSVQRMEESLKRLKKVKGQGSKVTRDGDGNSAFSDDDKIRRQIQIDIEYFLSKVRAICPHIDTASAEKLFEKK